MNRRMTRQSFAGLLMFFILGSVVDGHAESSPFIAPSAVSGVMDHSGTVLNNLRVSGIATLGEHKIAVFSSADKKFSLLKEGDLMNDFLITEITLDKVTLQSGDDTIVLPVSE